MAFAFRPTIGVLAVGLFACTLDHVDYTGPCSAGNACPTGYLCDQGAMKCVRLAADSGSSAADAGSDVDAAQEADAGPDVDAAQGGDAGGCSPPCTGDDLACSKGKCVSVSGCSDGTRDAYKSLDKYPSIAGCLAQWDTSSMLDETTGTPCGNSLQIKCKVPADACGAGWHVCAIPPYGAKDITEKLTAAECNLTDENVALAAGIGDKVCTYDSCVPDEVPTGDGAACCGSYCDQENGSCLYDGYTAWLGMRWNSEGQSWDNNTWCSIISRDSNYFGSLCCADP